MSADKIIIFIFIGLPFPLMVKALKSDINNTENSEIKVV